MFNSHRWLPRFLSFPSSRRGAKRRSKSLRMERLEGRDMFSLAGLPQLSSLPGAPNTVYLDFDSQTFTPKSGSMEGKSVTLHPYDFDGNPSTLSQAEKQMIEDIHARVSEDFAPFNVNVTTIKPAVDGLAGTNHVWHVAFLPHWSDAGFAGGASGGVGIIPGVPVVWAGYIGANSAQHATTASHELGHQLGLSHHHAIDAQGKVLLNNDGSVVQEYGTGLPGDDWSPIMGNNLLAQRTIWDSRSDTDNGKSHSWPQDDMTILGGKLGWRPDDHGDSASTATNLGYASPAFDLQTQGVIGKTTDLDWFSFVHPGGRVRIELQELQPLLQPGFVAANLDARLELRSGAGAALAIPGTTSNPGNQLGATIELANLPAGTYTVIVAGQGDYGDVGQYTLHVRPIEVAPDRFDDRNPVSEQRNDARATATLILGVVPAGASLLIDKLNFDTQVPHDIDFFTVQLDKNSLEAFGLKPPTSAIYGPMKFSVTVTPEGPLSVVRDFQITVYKDGKPWQTSVGNKLELTDPYGAFGDGRISFSIVDPEGVNFYALHPRYYIEKWQPPRMLYRPPLWDFHIFEDMALPRAYSPLITSLDTEALGTRLTPAVDRVYCNIATLDPTGISAQPTAGARIDAFARSLLPTSRSWAAAADQFFGQVDSLSFSKSGSLPRPQLESVLRHAEPSKGCALVRVRNPAVLRESH